MVIYSSVDRNVYLRSVYQFFLPPESSVCMNTRWCWENTKRHDWTGKSFVGRFWCPQRRTVIIICWLNRNTHLKMSREAQETGQVTSWTYKRSFPFGLPQSAHGSNKCGLAFLNHAKITNIPKPCYKQTLFTWVVFVAVLAVPVASDSLVDFTPLRTVYLRILDT